MCLNYLIFFVKILFSLVLALQNNGFINHILVWISFILNVWVLLFYRLQSLQVQNIRKIRLLGRPPPLFFTTVCALDEFKIMNIKSRNSIVWNWSLQDQYFQSKLNWIQIQYVIFLNSTWNYWSLYVIAIVSLGGMFRFFGHFLAYHRSILRKVYSFKGWFL